MEKEQLINSRLTEEEKIIILSLVAIENITTLKIHKALKKVNKISELANLTLRQFKNYFGKSCEDSYEKFQYNLSFNFKKYFEFYKVDYIFFDSEYYPVDLYRLYDFPLVIFYRGNKDLLLFKRKLSIVGTRNNTKYSEGALDIIVPHLVENNFVIVSGIASGVDGLAHIKTIRNKGYTIGVIAHGHNTIYPEENKYLYKIMEEKHLIISEYFPTTKIRKYRFLERNRLVAALGCGLLITEAGVKSGTSRTIEYALDIGNNVLCLPGRFGDKMSIALNEHIKSGAIMINKLCDINEAVGF
ncbi:DNA-processing protein DprA [Gemelliphila palaticanis]|uniref:DNA-protecting protein DprA n=1 Tax=Gemelliphila palaticanis TaxID=81950 RepID=A0ABX2T0H9_9BACL|nr:DNA-processing protein DprA [Gemella palaticanis]MBF0715957.1 DNA-protecting protein DprA [Gemella palaticanis]NYS47887.1 DNA-protecting protein DprA [Gemella palaticanis]